jgi:hypothetical protein
VATPKWPFKMELRPNDPCNLADEWDKVFYEDLDNLNGCVTNDAALFDVYA